MEKNEKMTYETPEMTVIEMSVEEGFAQSGGGSLNNDFGRESW